MKYLARMQIIEEGKDIQIVCEFCHVILYTATENWDNVNGTSRTNLLGYLIFNHKCFKHEQA